MSEIELYKEFDQCPICGDPLKKNKTNNGLICGCCGFNITQKTKISDEDKERLIQANEALRSYEFERAEARYNLIIQDNLDNEEIYLAALFGKLLSQFGVVYIKDTNGEMIPTFAEYNPSVKSMLTSSVYKQIISLKVKDEIKNPYINKINKLDEIYKRIDSELASNNEYDLFICTKISKKTIYNPNERGYTEDSRIADDFFQELRAKGLKIFYSDRCCNQVEYDSQILSALLKSKKILIIATEQEYLESAWVQSEWRRWLNFIDCGVKSKDSMILYFPYFEKEPFELPRVLRKVQRYSRLLQVVNMLTEQQEVKAIKEANKEDNGEELYQEAIKYYHGNGVEKSYPKCVELLNKAVKLNHPKAQFTLGYCYFNGQGVNKSHQEAVKYYKLASEAGNISAQCNLAHCYLFGLGIKEDPAEAFKLYEAAANQNDDYAKCKLSIFYRDGTYVKKSKKKEFDILMEAAENGYPKAQYIVGNYYFDGDGYPKESYSMAVKYYTKAAMQNYGDACHALASCYENGYGVEVNLDTALKYYQDAKKYGLDSIHTDIDATIQNITEKINEENDKKVKQEKKVAEEKKASKKEQNLKETAEANYEKAQKLEGQGKTSEAVKYYQLAADGGFAWAEYVIGDLYLNGKYGLNQSKTEAFKWFTRSHEHGYTYATVELGRCYEYGRGVKVDPKKALKYYKLASKKGDPRGTNMVGRCYERGTGCFKSSKKAFKYYKLAANEGGNVGKINMAWCYTWGKGVKADAYKAMAIFRDLLNTEKDRDCINECQYGLSYIMLNNYDGEYKDWRTKQAQDAECVKLLTDAAKHGHEKSKNLLYEKFGRKV